MVLASGQNVTPSITVNNVDIQKPIRIRRIINIYDSPIFTVTKNGVTVHIILDTGATTSLVSLSKAKELNLPIISVSS